MKYALRSAHWKFLLLTGAVLAPLGAVQDPAAAPTRRNDASVLAALATPASGVRGAVVSILDGQEQVALGTVVDRAGWILTKASELPALPLCRLQDGRTLPARVAGRDPNYDLALLALDLDDEQLPAVALAERPAELGRIVFAADADGAPLGMGLVGVAPRTISGRRGRLGLRLAFGVDGAVVAAVSPGTPAYQVGLRAEDRILRVDGEPVATRSAASLAIRRVRAGHAVKLHVARGETKLDFKPILAAAASGPDRSRESRMQGAQSSVRVGFPSALQHDVVLQPNQCGGPLVDLAGQTVGINIARAGRVASYAVPAEKVREILARLKP